MVISDTSYMIGGFTIALLMAEQGLKSRIRLQERT